MSINRIAKLEETLWDYIDALDRQLEAIDADRSQAEEDATLDVEMHEKRLRELLKR